MKTTSKHAATFLAALILCSTAAGYNPVRTPIAGAKAPSIRDFADSVLPKLPAQSDTAYESLCYSRERKTLLRDGETVCGDSFSGFRIVDGELRIAASETVCAGETAPEGWLSLEEAAPLIGLETYETEEGVYVSNPFRSGTLIVKAERLPDSAAASEIGSGWNGLHVLQYPTAADAYAAYQRLQQDEAVVFAEPNRVYHIAAAKAAANAGYQFPAENWGWEAIGADSFLTQYKDIAASAPQIKAAVIDTGLYEDHEWFSGRIAEGGRSFIKENGGSYDDLNGHGTHCAGIICGMTPENVKILPLKVMNHIGYGEAIGIYCAMLYAAEQHADVVSMSLGGLGSSPLLEEGVRVLTEQDIPCVVAAGNDAHDANYDSPANVPDAITVSALTDVSLQHDDSPYSHDTDPDWPPEDDYELSAFSNFGKRIDFAAPGDKIESAYSDAANSTAEMSGTSMATPHVAGCVADILTLQPDLTVSEVYDCLKSSALDLGEPGFDESYGWGMVNIAALDFCKSALPKPEASCKSGTYDEVFTVTLSTPEEGAEIRYTLDGTIPDTDTGILYDGGEITIDNTTALNAVTVKNGERSRCAHWEYTFFVLPPTIGPESGDYDYGLTIELYSSKAYDLYYTLDGSDPTPENGTRYTGVFRINTSAVLRAVYVVGSYISEEYTRCYRIYGQDIEPVFETEDGVLTRYCGVGTELDLNDYFAPGEITKIGDGAFQGQVQLRSITLPESVVTVGAHAFDQCTGLKSVSAPGVKTIEEGGFKDCSDLTAFDMPALQTIGTEGLRNAFSSGADENAFPADNQIREIGREAFYGCDLTRIELPHLQTLGEGAFRSCYELKTVRLSENITALPARCFMFCNSIETLDAPGVTELGDFALYMSSPDISPLETCTIDLSKLTSIGSHALSIFKKPELMGRVTFDALTHIECFAFEDFPASELCLPALKEIPQQAFCNAGCSVVYLEHAEKLEEGALTPNTELTSHIVYVFGDHVSRYQKNPLESGCDAVTVAAPAGSPMERFAQAAGCPYCSTPGIYIPESLRTCRQYAPVAVDEACFPLALGAKLTFTVTETNYAAGYDAPENPLFSDASGKHTMLDTSVPGKITLRADLTDSSGKVLTSETTEITIEAAADEDVVSKEGVVFIDWSAGDHYACNDSPLDLFSFPDSYGKHTFLFIPEKAGEYRFLPETSDTSISVYNSRNERISYIPGAYMVGRAEDEAESWETVVLKAGEPVRVVAATQSFNALYDQYAAVLITSEKPEQTLRRYDYEISLDGTEFDDTWGLFRKDTDDFDVSSFSLLYAFAEYEPDMKPELEKGVDFDYLYVPHGKDGTMFIAGKGSYLGMFSVPFTCCREYKIGETALLPEIRRDREVYYHVTVEQTGDYLISADYSEEYLQKHAAGMLTESLSGCTAGITVRDADMSPLHASDTSHYISVEEEIYRLSAGEEYYIAIEYYTDDDLPVTPEGMRALTVTPFDAGHWMGNCEADIIPELRFSGNRMNFIRSVTAPDGTVLEEGRDFCVYLDNASVPGKGMELIICGIGDYHGIIYENIKITEPYISSGPFAVGTIRPDEPFTVSKDAGCFELQTDSTCVFRLRNTDHADPDVNWLYTVSQHDEDVFGWSVFYAGYNHDGDSVLELEPGTYRFYFSQDVPDQEYMLETLEKRPGIGNAEVQAAALTATGEELEPEITLTLDGKNLTEGKDYVLLYPEQPLIACGDYELTAAGIGAYSGERRVRVTVQQQNSPALPAVKIGSNTLTVTEPGKEAAGEWCPDTDADAVRLYSLHPVSLTVCDTETSAEVFRLEGNGYLSGIMNVIPGRTYRIYASWLSTAQTGDITFTLLSDFTDLSTCTVDCAVQTVFTESGKLPEFTVKNGETILKQNEDYNIYYNGGSNEAGHALLSLTGTGNCVGELKYHYYLAPALDAETFDADEATLTLQADSKPYVLMPGEMQQFVFEAPQDGSYRIDRPDQEYAGVCVFVYGTDGELLPLDTVFTELKKGEKLRFFAVSEHLEDYLDANSSYPLAVYAAEPESELQTGDCVYLIRNGAAYLHQYTGENIGIQLPETLADPDSKTVYPVKGCTPELLEALGASRTFYCAKDSECFSALLEAGCCAAVPEPQTGIAGDITGDGTVDSNDLLTALRCMTECPGMLLNDAAFAAADRNGDGCLDLSDIDALDALAAK